MKQKKLLKQIHNVYAAKTISVSQNGKMVATGCINGRVYIYDTGSLKKLSEIVDVVNPDKEIISMIKFSPNCEVLVVCYKPPQSEIVLYSTKTWKRVKEFTKCEFDIVALDFTQDSKYL